MVIMRAFLITKIILLAFFFLANVPGLSAQGCGADVTIDTGQSNTFCPRDTARFTAIPDNGGEDPVFEWAVNGTPKGADSSVFEHTNLSDGDQVVVTLISDSCNNPKEATDSVTIDVVEIDADGEATDTATCDSKDGTIAVSNVTGGTPPYSFKLNEDTTQTDSLFENVEGGVHNITIEDANGCKEFLKVVVPVENSIQNAWLSTVAENCEAENGKITVDSVAEGAPSYTIEVSGPDSASIGPTSLPVSVEDLPMGFYEVTITGSDGCPFVVHGQFVERTEGIKSVPMDSEGETCAGGDGVVEVDSGNIQGGTAPYEYSIDGGVFQQNPRLSGLEGGSHKVVVKDRYGCTLEKEINVAPPPAPQLNYSSTPADCDNREGSITIDSVSGGTPPYTFFLDGRDKGTSREFEFLDVGSHTIIVEDANGCTDTVQVQVQDECPDLEEMLFVPNTVTPNGDGKNDVWIIRGIERFPDNTVTIHSRWGQVVHKETGYDNNDPWKPDKDLPAATYYYVIETDDEERGEEQLTGAVTIVR